jgi:sugar lactone lactonase YvrE
MPRSPWLVVLAAIGACSPRHAADAAPILSVTGLAGPEAVRHDPDQDVWFVSNFNGEAAGDSNGFISRVTADGAVDSLRFMTGTLAPLHGPRGMFITGDTLWVADADGVHGFHRRSGAHLAFVDLRTFEPGFLNDVAQGPDGALYVTDTGRSRVYRLAGRAVTIAIEDSVLGPPNGITWDSAGGRFLLAGWGAGGRVRAWQPGTTAVPAVGTLAAGRFDGVEILDGRILVASQSDSSIHTISGGRQEPLFRTPGRPADIGVDRGRRRVAVPYIALDRVDVWELP